MKNSIQFNSVKEHILTLRNQKVILDCDVARLYDVQTKEVNQAVKNNLEKFPDGYILELDPDEKEKKPTQKGRFLAFYRVALSCRKAPPEFRFAPSTLRNFVPSGAAHEAAAGHAPSEPPDHYTAIPDGDFSVTSTIL